MKLGVPGPDGHHSTLFAVCEIKFMSPDSRIGHWEDKIKAHLKNMF
jgi:hypothetical protein